MRTATRRVFKKEDLFYDGISYGTPLGQVMFCWINEVWFKVIIKDDVSDEIIFSKDYDYNQTDEAMKVVNLLIKQLIMEDKS